MSDESKFASLGPSIKPTSSGNGNGSEPRSVSPADIAPGEKRRANPKPAFFFLAVAFLLILSNWLGQTSEAPDANATRPPLQDVSLVLHPRPRAESRLALLVQFRLSNMGNHSVFYPVRPGTNVPVGQIVAGDSKSSQRMTRTGISNQHGSVDSELIDASLLWIEMPPGGWIDGEFFDPGQSTGDHAYTILLRPDRHVNGVSIVSEPYHFDHN